MSSLTEVQRLIGLSLNKLQMGRAGRGGLSLHKNLLVATVLNKARDVYMQETMYMNYRLMACGQFSQEDQEEMEDEDTPDTEDYEEDSESDVEDDSENSLGSKEYSKEYVGGSGVGAVALPSLPSLPAAPAPEPEPLPVAAPQAEPTTLEKPTEAATTEPLPCASSNDEGFIDETDCDCDARNYRHSDGENRVPFQYCFNCAPFHPSNGRGPTLVSPQPPSSPSCLLAQPCQPQQENKLIYDMDSKSTENQPAVAAPSGKRKRQISSEETTDAINSILPKKRRESEGAGGLDDSGYAEEEEKVFHPAFRGQPGHNGMEVDQITSLVSIFSFGQQLFGGGPESGQPNKPPQQSKKTKKKDAKDQEDESDSDSDTSSDSGHSSDDPDAEKKAVEDAGCTRHDLLCSAMAKEQEQEAGGGSPPPVTAAV